MPHRLRLRACNLILAFTALGGCAAATVETQPTRSTTTTTAAAPRPASQAVSELGLITNDVHRIEEISRLDHENQMQTEKVKGLEKSVADLQAKLAEAVRRGGGDPASPSPTGAATSEPVSMVESPSRTRVQVRLPGELLFEPGSARISRPGRRMLASITGVLKETPSRRIEVAGHTDSSPTAKKYEDNWQLSGERARRVVTFLASQGVDPHHLVAIGYGDSEPLDQGQSSESRARNRRVEIFIDPAGE